MQNQEKLKIPAEKISHFTTDPDIVQARVHDWLLGYLTPEAAQMVAREIIQLKYPNKRKGKV